MENTNHPNEEEGESQKHRKRASAAALIDAFVDEYRTDRTAYNYREKHRVFREWLTIVFLFVAATAGIIQAFIFIGQLHEMEKVLGPIQDQAMASKSRHCCEKMSDATRAYVKLSEKAAEGQRGKLT